MKFPVALSPLFPHKLGLNSYNITYSMSTYKVKHEKIKK